jgi:hypothetical protein
MPGRAVLVFGGHAFHAKTQKRKGRQEPQEICELCVFASSREMNAAILAMNPGDISLGPSVFGGHAFHAKTQRRKRRQEQ